MIYYHHHHHHNATFFDNDHLHNYEAKTYPPESKYTKEYLIYTKSDLH
jgi:hypothetical protein